MFDLSQVKEDWLPDLSYLTVQPSALKLFEFLREERQAYTVYPDEPDVFRALCVTAKKNVKVVVVGQDPYHSERQAHGLAFSVPDATKIPPSLRNIFKELENDLGIDIPRSGNLTKWAFEGVLLLNSVLTVRSNAPGSHRNLGWEEITSGVVKALSVQSQPTAFIFWGSSAGKFRAFVDSSRHLIIESAHPSPLSARRGFFGSCPFSKVNHFLREIGRRQVDWQL